MHGLQWDYSFPRSPHGEYKNYYWIDNIRRMEHETDAERMLKYKPRGKRDLRISITKWTSQLKLEPAQVKKTNP
jgi:hypothetical protein